MRHIFDVKIDNFVVMSGLNFFGFSATKIDPQMTEQR